MKGASRTTRLRDALGYISQVSAALHVACSRLRRNVLLRLILDMMVDALGKPVETAALYVHSGDNFLLQVWRGPKKPTDRPPESVTPFLGSLKIYEIPTPSCLPDEEGPILIIPLSVQAEVLGFVCFHSVSMQDLDEIQQEVLSALGSVCAISVKMFSIYEELAQKVRELQETQKELLKHERFATISRIVASVTHEIKNPLSAAFGLVQLLQEGVPVDRDTLFRLRRNLERANNLVKKLLDYSKPSKPQKVLVKAEVLLEETIDLFLPVMKHKRVEIVRDYQKDLYVLVDKGQMGDVFMNLLMNALDAMPRGGTITLKIEAVPDGMVCFSVCDTGVGISKEKLDHIFEPFFTTKEKKGTGLGLYNCYNTVKLHNGRIEVESELGKGTCFKIYIPGAPVAK